MLWSQLANVPVFSGSLLCHKCKTWLTAVGIRYVSQSHYETMGLEKSASQREIRDAFLSLSKKLHPDVNADPKNHERFVRLNEAYAVLSKPIERREYDLTLAAHIYMEQQKRNASSSHVHGSSAWPGSNFDHSENVEQQRFWDETIWTMRNQARDKEFENKPYYGFGTITRLPNSYILIGCFLLMVTGIFIHYFAIRKSREAHKAVLDEKDKKYYSHLAKARTLARSHGNHLQLQILRSKVNKTPLEVEGTFPDTVKDAFVVDKKK